MVAFIQAMVWQTAGGQWGPTRPRREEASELRCGYGESIEVFGTQSLTVSFFFFFLFFLDFCFFSFLVFDDRIISCATDSSWVWTEYQLCSSCADSESSSCSILKV